MLYVNPTETSQPPGNSQRLVEFKRMAKSATRICIALACSVSLVANSYAMEPRSPAPGDLTNGCSALGQLTCPLPNSSFNVNQANSSNAGCTAPASPSTVTAVTVNEAANVAQQGAEPNHAPPGVNANDPEVQAIKKFQDEVLKVAIGTVIQTAYSAWTVLSATTISAAPFETVLTIASIYPATFFLYGISAILSNGIYIAIRKYHPRISQSNAEWIAFVVLAGVANGLAGLYTQYASNSLNDKICKSKGLPGLPHDELRRKLLSSGPKTGAVGNMFVDVLYAISKLTIDGAGRVTIPGMLGGPKTRFMVPSVEFGSNDNTVGIAVQEYIYNENTKSWQWEYRQPAQFTPAALDKLPVKVVSDNHRIWLLSGHRGKYGYKIFTKHENEAAFKSGQLTDETRKAMIWHRHEGEAIDIFPGQHYVWLTNSEQDIYACAQPCGNHTWIKVRGKAQNVAVGPSLNLATKSTKGQPSYVWVKDGNGKVWRRAEADVTGDFWLEMKKAAEIPQRIKDLLNERDSFYDWLDRNKFKYPELPFPPHDWR